MSWVELRLATIDGTTEESADVFTLYDHQHRLVDRVRS